MDIVIVIGQGQDYGEVRWQDIKKLQAAEYLYGPFINMNSVLKFLCHVNTSFRINKLINLRFKGIWKSKYSISNLKLNDENHYYIIFTDNALARYDEAYTMKLHQQQNVTLVLMITNAMYRRGTILMRHFPYLDLIYTFSKTDAEKYGLLFQPDIYSEITYDDNSEICHDIFFAGCANDRLPILHDVYERLESNGIETAFYIQKVRRGQRIKGKIRYNKWLNYDQIIKNNMSSNCILEVVGEKFTGMTLRTVEALTFKKKLLTNNSSIREMDFFDERFIQVFDKVENIDTDFIKRRRQVEYKYENVYSPTVFVERVKSDFRKVRRSSV